MKEKLLESEFVTYSIALKMKVLGFDKPCFSFYTLKNEENKIFYDIDPDDGQLTSLNQNAIYANNLREVGRISAPTWQSAFTWFEEKYKIHGIPKPIIGSKNGYDSFPVLGWDYDIISLNQGSKNSYYMGYPVGEWFTATLDNFDEGETLSDLGIEPNTKKEAQKLCLERICEIVENKKD